MALAALVFLLLAGCGTQIVYSASAVSEAEAISDSESSFSGTSDSEASDASREETATDEKIYVYICGAVQNPGVYALKEGSRVYEAVDAAGGLTDNADLLHTNQARVLTDGEQVTILTEEEAEDLPVDTETVLQTPSEETGESGLVNINTATKEQLKTLNGIGDARAEAIIAYREENGTFRSIDDIMKVTGIGESLFSNIKDAITVG